MATILKHAHKNLEDFLHTVAHYASNGDFFDASKWPRHYYGNRPYAAFPNVDITTTRTPPASSGKLATSGELMYVVSFPQPFGQFLNDFQVAIANNKSFGGLTLTDYSLKPYFRANAKMSSSRARVTAAGQTQYSANGSTGWSNSIPNGILTAGAPVDFYVRVNPSSVVAADDDTYDYQFNMTSGAGGLTLTNDSSVQNKAHITGTTPANQTGVSFSVNTTITDSFGTNVTGTALTKVWA